MKRLLWVFFGLLLLAPMVAFVIAQIWRMPGELQTPSGDLRNSALYVPAADGTRIALDLWLPKDLQPGQRVPTVIEGTRYWRDIGLTRIGRVAAMFGLSLPGAQPPRYARYFNGKGYAFVVVDVRGTGASFGVHDAEYSLQEVSDYAVIFDWIAAQPWSSGSIASIGVSYGGTSAELMTTLGHPALKAAAPLYSDFDSQFHLATPGGVFQPAFIDAWSAVVAAMDANDMCTLAALDSDEPMNDFECTGIEWLVQGVKPVDEAAGGRLIARAVAEHTNPNVAETARKLVYRDSTWADTGLRGWDNQIYGRKEEVEASRTPLFVVTGWHDAATTNGALARFVSFSNPQTVWIGPFNHGGGQDADPYNPVDTTSVWPDDEQLDRVETFFRDRLDGKPLEGKTLHYYVLGAKSWKTTEQWPPRGVEPRPYYLSADNKLFPTIGEEGTDTYRVDFAVGTAASSRWATQLGGGDVFYDRRKEMAARSLSYVSPAFADDTELTGTVVADLWLASTRSDAALHIYLDDVSPTGDITYLTEGVLRLLHRAETDTPFYPEFGPAHSFLAVDAKPMPLDSIERVRMGLYATSALIRKGHRLQISIAGADSASFVRVPSEGEPPVLTFYRGTAYPSSVSLPLANWRSN